MNEPRQHEYYVYWGTAAHQFDWDPARPAKLPTPQGVGARNWRPFARALVLLITRAPRPSLAREWYDLNVPDMLRQSEPLTEFVAAHLPLDVCPLPGAEIAFALTVAARDPATDIDALIDGDLMLTLREVSPILFDRVGEHLAAARALRRPAEAAA